ncbi:hypothetical protein I315_04330 [Cryptococcus gattii Ru294]|nr:hypothetical protein I315_04330 [Cryptococcus gattii Ru294]
MIIEANSLKPFLTPAAWNGGTWAVRPRLSQDRWLPQRRIIHLPGLNETMMYIHYPGSVKNGRKSRIPN